MFNFMFTFLQQQSFLWPLYKSSHGESTKNIPYESKRKWARIGRSDLETATGEISPSVSEISLSEAVSYSSSCGGRTAPTTTSIRGTQRQFSLRSFETLFEAIWSGFKAL